MVKATTIGLDIARGLSVTEQTRISGCVILLRISFLSRFRFTVVAGVLSFPMFQSPIMIRDKAGRTASHAGRLDHEAVDRAYQFASELRLGRHVCPVRA